jgi:serine/threonine protein phosphatase PrpC
MQEKIKIAYTNHRWLRLTVLASLLSCTFLLYWRAGGFPPWAWRFLFQVTPQLPRLWQLHHQAIVLPFAGLLCLSLVLLLLWGAIPVALFRMALYWWNTLRERQYFLQELQEAEQQAKRQAERMVADEPQQATALPAAFLAENYSPAYPPSAVSLTRGVSPQTNASSEVRAYTAPAAVSESVAMQRAEREPQFVPVGAGHVSPALTRGQLRLVPRQDEEAEEELDDFPEIELAEAQEEPIDLEIGVGLHPGFQRKDAPNEDALFELRGTHTAGQNLQQVGLFVVADGMGNSGFGHEASRLAIQVLSSVMVPALLSNTKLAFADLLKEGVQSANLAVYRRNRELAETRCKMGTAMTVALTLGPVAHIANVGNSRAYLYQQKQGLSQVTRDHTVASSLLRDNDMAAVHSRPVKARQGVLERYLGRQALVEVDLFSVNLCGGDILLLCSDGLWAMVRDAEIEEILGTAGLHPIQLSAMLVQRALNYGGADNISIIAVRCPQNLHQP